MDELHRTGPVPIEKLLLDVDDPRRLEFLEKAWQHARWESVWESVCQYVSVHFPPASNINR